MKSIARTLRSVCLTGLLIGLVTCSSDDQGPLQPTPGPGSGPAKPSITSMDPVEGPASGGTRVEIHGGHLDTVVTASFLDVPAQIVSRAPDTLVVITGSLIDLIGNITEDVTGDVKVTNSNGGTDVATDAWTYKTVVGVQPVVTGVCPPFWPAEDPDTFIPSTLGITEIGCDFDGDGVPESASTQFTSVKITGANLDFVDASDGVTLVGIPVESVLSQSESSLIVDPGIFSGAATTTGDVVVTTATGTTATLPQSFTYIVGGINPESPDAFQIDPNVVSEAGGIFATITGQKLSNVDRVQFVNGNTVAGSGDISVNSDTEIVVRVPRFQGTILGSQITGQVIVSAGTLVDPTPVSPFTYVKVLSTAQCVSISQTTGTDGDQIIVRGEDLGDVVNDPPIAVAVPEVDGDASVVTNVIYRDTSATPDGRANEVRFTLATGLCVDRSVTIDLVNDLGDVLDACSLPFDYVATFSVDPADQGDSDPSTNNPSPNTGDASGGTSVTITGCGMLNVSSVAFCDQPGTILSRSADGTSVTVRTPPAPGGGGDVCDVRVSAGTTDIVLQDAFTYNAGLPDGQIMSPVVGPLCGGTSFRLTGENLLGVDKIRFGMGANTKEVPVTLSVSDTEVQAVTPTLDPGLKPLAPIVASVTALDTAQGVEDSTPLTFVFGHPTLTAVTTCQRPGDTGTLVGKGFRETTTGRNLVAEVVFSSGGTEAGRSFANVTNPTLLEFIVPPLATGDYTVTVTVPNDDASCFSTNSLPIRVFSVEEDPTCSPGGCTDGEDNDGDGDTDCSDSDCPCPGGTSCDAGTHQCVESSCDDRVDNDGDGQKDCGDANCPGCAAGASCNPAVSPAGNGSGGCVETACADGLDNDGDGALDCNDAADCSCPSGTICDPLGSGACLESACDDRLDNDGDGDVDCQDATNCAPFACGSGASCDPATSPAGNGSSGCIETDCTDSVDNDLDTFVDCDDPDCPGCPAGTACMPGGTCAETACNDHLDNDGDGQTDEADSDCGGCLDGTDDDGDGCDDTTDSDCGGVETICNDGLDNDCDGRTDEADSDCGSCLNEIDDDGDGLTDGSDPDCIAVGEDGCKDGLDDDGDGRIDEADAKCYPVPGGSCFDGVDNDADSFTDCDDANCCMAEPGCSGIGTCP